MVDRAHFGVDRAAFLDPWIRPGGLALGLVEGGDLRAIGVARPCREGFKVGPLFAEDADSAERVFAGLGAITAGQPVFLDVPEVNVDALGLADRHGLEEVFGCARILQTGSVARAASSRNVPSSSHRTRSAISLRRWS